MNIATSLPILFCTPHIEVRKLTTPFKEGSLSDEKYFSVAIVPSGMKKKRNNKMITFREFLCQHALCKPTYVQLQKVKARFYWEAAIGLIIISVF
ncbi:TPA: hypothetical protein ACKRI4_000927 [Proteus mirabilis]|nr:hypothetical protein [Proteus mirabilis]